MSKPFSQEPKTGTVRWFKTSDPLDSLTNEGFLTDAQIANTQIRNLRPKIDVIRNLEEWSPDKNDFNDVNVELQGDNFSPGHSKIQILAKLRILPIFLFSLTIYLISR